MKNEFLRHTLSTIKYRFDKSVINAGEHFGQFSLGEGVRTPSEIIHHMFQVLHATRVFVEEEKFVKDFPRKLGFTNEIERFSNELVEMDRALDKNELPLKYSKKLLQGPLSDILTHIGQISMMQRLNGNPIEGQDFSSVQIQTGLLNKS